MTTELALVPQFIGRRGNKIQENVLSVLLGIFCLSALAQIAIPLPWTPVPITGQTFGVALTALLWGRTRATIAMFGYLLLGAAGLPVFAGGSTGLLFGPTTGYLIGMVIATYWIGTLADRGWTRTWPRTYLSAASGSVIVFTCGVTVLSFFLPSNELLAAGVLPFLPGDLIKTLLASTIAYRASQ